MRYADPLAQAEIDRLRARLDAVAALHRRAEPSAWAVRTDYCQEDGDVWPCITARAIGVEQ